MGQNIFNAHAKFMNACAYKTNDDINGIYTDAYPAISQGVLVPHRLIEFHTPPRRNALAKSTVEIQAHGVPTPYKMIITSTTMIHIHARHKGAQWANYMAVVGVHPSTHHSNSSSHSMRILEHYNSRGVLQLGSCLSTIIVIPMDATSDCPDNAESSLR